MIKVFSVSRLSGSPSQAVSTIRFNIFSRLKASEILYYTTADEGVQIAGSISPLKHYFKNRYLQLFERIWLAHRLQPDIILFTGDFFEIFFYFLRPRCARTMLHLNGPVLKTLAEYPYPTGRDRLLRWTGAKFFIRRVDSILAISKYVADSAKQFGVKADTYVIFNGVDLDQFKPAGNAPENGPLVFAGSLIRRKRPDIIVELARRLPEYKFIIVGEVASESDPRIAGSISATPNILWHRHLGRAEMAKLFASASAFVFPSLFEGFGMVIAEAMAAGTPAVATSHGGIPELIDHGVSGMLIEHSGDRNRELIDFERAIATIMRDGELLAKMRRGARQSAEKNYDWNNLAKSWSTVIYEQATKRC